MSEQDPNRPSRPVDLSDEQVHWDLGESQSYGQYLVLDQLLSAQRPVSVEHDEMLFIIIHQASELWMKLCLHELTAARDHIRRDDLGPSFKMLARVSRIQAQLVQSWDVLATMTPAEYSMFRNQLGRASGFQSVQYRTLEFVIGNKNAEMIEVHRRDAAAYEALQRALLSPSIYDEVVAAAEPAGLRDSPGIRSIATGRSPTRRTSRSPPRGYRCITASMRTGTCTSSRRSWWISIIISSSGASVT